MEIASEEQGETPAEENETAIEEDVEIASEEQGEIPAEENDPETESPEETN